MAQNSPLTGRGSRGRHHLKSIPPARRLALAAFTATLEDGRGVLLVATPSEEDEVEEK